MWDFTQGIWLQTLSPMGTFLGNFYFQASLIQSPIICWCISLAPGFIAVHATQRVFVGIIWLQDGAFALQTLKVQTSSHKAASSDITDGNPFFLLSHSLHLSGESQNPYTGFLNPRQLYQALGVHLLKPLSLPFGEKRDPP